MAEPNETDLAGGKDDDFAKFEELLKSGDDSSNLVSGTGTSTSTSTGTGTGTGASSKEAGKTSTGGAAGTATAPADIETNSMQSTAPNSVAARRWATGHGLLGVIREINRGFVAGDGTVRWMVILFWLGIVGMGVTAHVGWKYFNRTLNYRAQLTAAEDAKRMGEFFQKQAEENRRKGSTLSLGEFTLELKKRTGQKSPPGALNMAEMQLVAECDTKDTCDFIEKHITEVRNELTNVFMATDRDELLSLDGKQKLKQMMLDRINGWLPSGKLQNIFISRLLIS